MNFLGLAAAIAAFAGIWGGHVAVRRIEADSARLLVPVALALSFGLALEAAAWFVPWLPVKSALGILGVTLLWDALELKRQERRVRRGHAPANPLNPRHAAFLSEPGTMATALDLLKRGPEGTS